jgi:uncharacterized protein (TIGR00297 family)
MADPQYSERARKVVHMAMGVFALALRYLTWWQAAVLAGVALAFNLLVLPRIARQLYRPTDHARRFPAGIIFYPVSILLLILIFPYRLDIVAAAWGILAFGDGMATLAGMAFGRKRIPWNREKSILGSVAFFVCGGVAGAFLAWWCRPGVIPPAFLWFSIGAPFVAALAAAFVETIPVRLDDNISVPASAALVLWALSLVNTDLVWSTATGAGGGGMVTVIALNLVIAFAGYLAGTVTRAGAIGGSVIGMVIAATTGWRGWTLLFVTFLAAAVSSRLGLRRKTLLGIAEDRGGRRGVGNAIANTGFAAGAALLSAWTYAHDAALLAFATALAAGGSDTFASEIGKAWGRRTYLVSNLRVVPPGTPGAMSLEGTIAGLLAAAGLAAVAILLGLVGPTALLPVVIGATAGSLCESLLAVSLEGPGILNNDWLNFLNTAIAAMTALFVARLFV